MGDFLKSRLGKVLATGIVAGALAVICAKFPGQAAYLAPIALAVAAALPSALAAPKNDDEPKS